MLLAPCKLKLSFFGCNSKGKHNVMNLHTVCTTSYFGNSISRSMAARYAAAAEEAGVDVGGVGRPVRRFSLGVSAVGAVVLIVLAVVHSGRSDSSVLQSVDPASISAEVVSVLKQSQGPPPPPISLSSLSVCIDASSQECQPDRKVRVLVEVDVLTFLQMWFDTHLQSGM